MTVRDETTKEFRETESDLKQSVTAARGEPARWPCDAYGHAGRSGVSAIAVELHMNNAGQDNAHGQLFRRREEPAYLDCLRRRRSLDWNQGIRTEGASAWMVKFS